MIRLHCTKKLFAKLPVNTAGRLPVPKGQSNQSAHMPEALNPLSGWHGNLVLMQRRNCIVLVHDTTRFPLFIPCLTKPDFAKLDGLFADALMNTLLKCDANEVQMATASQLLQPLVLDTDGNRSVQGTLNQLKQDIDHVLWYDNVSVADISAYRLSQSLAQRPYNIKDQGAVFPQWAMLKLLDQAANLVERGAQPEPMAVSTEAAQSSNVISFAAFKKP